MNDPRTVLEALDKSSLLNRLPPAHSVCCTLNSAKHIWASRPSMPQFPQRKVLFNVWSPILLRTVMHFSLWFHFLKYIYLLERCTDTFKSCNRIEKASHNFKHSSRNPNGSLTEREGTPWCSVQQESCIRAGPSPWAGQRPVGDHEHAVSLSGNLLSCFHEQVLQKRDFSSPSQHLEQWALSYNWAISLHKTF